MLLSTLVVSILLFLSNFGLAGKFGEIINSVTFGLFGFLAYLIPFLLFFGIAFYLANRKDNKRYIIRLVASFGLFAVIAGFIQLTIGMTEDASILDFYKYAAEHKNGGGFLGGLLCVLLTPAFGKAGSYVVLAALAIVCLMVLTGKALFALLAEYSAETARKRREQRQYREELYEQQELEFEETRAQSFLLKPAEEEKKEEKKPPKKNFFGGVTPTVPAGKEVTESTTVEQQNPAIPQPSENTQTVSAVHPVEEPKLDTATEQLVFNGTYTPSKETVETVNSIYEEELRKKFDHVPAKETEAVPVRNTSNT